MVVVERVAIGSVLHWRSKCRWKNRAHRASLGNWGFRRRHPRSSWCQTRAGQQYRESYVCRSGL